MERTRPGNVRMLSSPGSKLYEKKNNMNSFSPKAGCLIFKSSGFISFPVHFISDHLLIPQKGWATENLWTKYWKSLKPAYLKQGQNTSKPTVHSTNGRQNHPEYKLPESSSVAEPVIYWQKDKQTHPQKIDELTSDELWEKIP